MNKDEFPDYMHTFGTQLSAELKHDLNRHIDSIIK